MVNLPNLGFSLIDIIRVMFLKHGALVSITIGGLIAFKIIKSYIHFEKTDIDTIPEGEWEDYMTAWEEEKYYNPSTSFKTQMWIRRCATNRMYRKHKK